MSVQEKDLVELEAHEAQLERALIAEFLRERGHTWASLYQLAPEEQKRLLRRACIYASIRLEELHDKAQMAQALHHVSEGCSSHLARTSHTRV